MVDQAEIHRKVASDDVGERREGVEQLRNNFADLPDKDAAWEDLIRLIGDEDPFVRSGAAGALSSAFQYVSDKDEAWKDLHRLTQDKDSFVRLGAAGALGSAFQYVSDKDEAWEDLIRLIQDKDSSVRASANHSLGRASIFRATETENKDDFECELKNAIEFFERSSNEMTYFNPSRFCLPFYKSFYTVTFEKEGAKDEVQRYLAEAKSASEGSENKETLLEAVENLANALLEGHNTTDFDIKKSELNSYRRYCDRAADLIGDALEGAPGAARVLRRRLPIIDDRIKENIREVQENAGAVCRETQETPLEELGLATARSAQGLPIQNPLALTMALGNMASIARDWCEYLPIDKKVDACEQLKNLTDMEILEQGAALARVFEYAQENIHIPKIRSCPKSRDLDLVIIIQVRY